MGTLIPDDTELCWGFWGEATDGMGECVGVGEVGLDVDDGRAVNEVDATKFENRGVGALEVDTLKLHTRHTEGIRTEGGSAGKYTDLVITPESWRTDERLPRCGAIGRGVLGDVVLVKEEDQPEVGKAFKSTQGIRITVGWLEGELSPCFFDEARLARDAKLLTVAGA